MSEESSEIPSGGGSVPVGLNGGNVPPGMNRLDLQEEEGGGVSRIQAAVITAVVILLLGGAYVFLVKIPSVRAAGDSQTGLEKIRREYLERSAFAYGVADPGRYAEERRALFKWYKNQLTEHENKFPGSIDITGFEKELKRRDGKQAEQYEKRYREVKDFYGLIDSGKYIPVFTAADKGLRFDIVRLEPVSSGGEPSVRLHFALYGIQRVWVNEQRDNGSHVFRMKTNLKFDQFKVVGRDAAGKQKFEMSIAGGEPFNVNYPERFISEFPPALVLGYYEIPRLPEADKVELEFSIGTRSVVSGLEGLGTFSWTMSSAEMPPELKLPSGQEWKNAETRVVESE